MKIQPSSHSAKKIRSRDPIFFPIRRPLKECRARHWQKAPILRQTRNSILSSQKDSTQLSKATKHTAYSYGALMKVALRTPLIDISADFLRFLSFQRDPTLIMERPKRAVTLIIVALKAPLIEVLAHFLRFLTFQTRAVLRNRELQPYLSFSNPANCKRLLSTHTHTHDEL